ncbi:MAG: hypothetical protein AAF927_02570 [Bacteroidota bacterium]
MQEFPNPNTLSYKMCYAIKQGMYDVCISDELVDEIANKMVEMLLKYEDSFDRCSNEMRNMFLSYTSEIEIDLQLVIAQSPLAIKKRWARLAILWPQVVQLIFEGLKPYEVLRQVCQQIDRIIQDMDPDHDMIIRMESMCSLLLIWIDFHEPESMLPRDC